MYQILIVDDEKIERRGIRFLLKKMGIELEIYEAANGKEALEILQEKEIDILCTDVKMPFMNGLELIQQILPKKPELCVVIFSGYSEFEYAKHAIQLGVYNYILKPVDPKEFEKTMSKIMKILDHRQLDRELKEKEQDFMKEHILYSLVNGISLEVIAEKVKGECQTAFLEEIDCLFLVEFSSDFFGKVGLDFPTLLKKEISWEFMYLNLNLRQCLIFAKKEMEITPKQGAEQLYNTIRKQCGMEAYIAASDKKEKIEALDKEFEALELLMEQKFYQPEQHIFMEQMKDNVNLLSQINDDMLLKQIRQDLRMKDIEALKEHFNRLCEKYRNKQNFSQVYIKFIFSSLLKDFYKTLPKEKEGTFNQDIDRLYRAERFSEVMEIIGSTITYLEEEFSMVSTSLHKEINEVTKYIALHYGEEIGVEQLADVVHMTPSYLSYLFKKEMGQNLSKYIKSYRMEKAKEQLESTEEKIATISYQVGYTNVSYFCQSFREYFGVSPQKYRDGGGHNDTE